MTNLPINFDYDNCLDMIKLTLMELLFFLDKEELEEAKKKCNESLKSIEILKRRKKYENIT